MMENAKISSLNKSVSELLLSGNIVFRIPDFQRDFVWTENEIKDLINDFDEDSRNFEQETDELSGYLLGNIVLIGQGKDFEVIDGQQRLTTLTIIFKALQAYASNKANDLSAKYQDRWRSYSTNLSKGFSLTSDLGDYKGLKIRHDSSLSFGDFYRRLMEDDLDVDHVPDKETDKNIQSIYEYVVNFFDSENMTEEKMIRFINYLTENVFLIMTTAPNESKAFQLFEVLNDRGRSLEPLDLIKNMFLKIITKNDPDNTQKKEFLRHWSKFSDNLEYPMIKDKRRSKLSSSSFLSSYILAFEGENIRKNDLFEYFKDQHDNLSSKELIDFAKNVSRVSEVYSRLSMKEYGSYLRDSHKEMTIFYEILGNEQSKAMLMPFYFVDDEDKKKVLDATNRYVASILFSFTQANQIESFIPKMIQQYKSNQDIDKLVAFINKETAKYAVDIKDSLPTRRLENKNGTVSKKATTMYRFLEGYYCNRVDAITSQTGKRFSIEHIMSKKLTVYDYSAMGFKDKEEFDQYLNRIGNLSLIYTTDNSSLSNKPFDEKISHYKEIDFLLTKKLGMTLTTSVIDGKDTKLINQINKSISTPNLKSKQHYFTKSMIDKRSDEVSQFLADILIQKI
ncbi:DUF262 domain-containing protein [Jeotgalicoccus nanhaiensis]|nr:DUF262 domain-containing protein [Jeotgalicoccus nanhaiensis]